MCEALKDLLKDELKKEFMAAETRGEISGAIKIYHEEVELSPSEIEKKIFGRFSLEKKSAEEYVTKTLGVELV